MNKKISFKYKQLILPAVVNGILVLMIIGVASFAINKTSELNHNVSATSKENDVLSARLSTLESSSQTVDEAKSSVTVALPANNSATLVISQLRRLANENEVTLDDLSLFINDKPGDVVDIKEITKKISAAARCEFRNIFFSTYFYSTQYLTLAEISSGVN